MKENDEVQILQMRTVIHIEEAVLSKSNSDTEIIKKQG
jgi:hypothetical protein